MRIGFVSMVTKKEAKALMPWACKVIKVEGGWKGFESVDDYIIWSMQQ